VFVLVLLLLRRLGVPLRLTIELVLAFLTAERILLAFKGAGCRRLVFVYLLSANGIFRHDVFVLP
jgi:hypothetical protein